MLRRARHCCHHRSETALLRVSTGTEVKQRAATRDWALRSAREEREVFEEERFPEIKAKRRLRMISEHGYASISGQGTVRHAERE